MLGQYIKNQRILAVLFLGFSSGLPLALTGSTLQAWFTQAGVNLMAIGALSLIGLPYVWKFLWAPVFDRYVPPFLGRRRAWVFITQIMLCLLLLWLAQLNPGAYPEWVGVLALVIAFMSASQDIAYDAYRTDVLLPDERGLGAASVTFGYRMAMLLAGGFALMLADHIGWKLTYEIMAGLIGLCAIVTFYAPDPIEKIQAPKLFKDAVVQPFVNLLQRDSIVMILLFILFYKIGDALALSLMSNFLLRELGFTLTDVGVAFKIFGLIATILGAFVGGILMIRISLFQALFWFGLSQAFSNLMFVILAMAGKNYFLMVSAIFIESFCSGLSTAAFIAFIMSLCDKRFTATQYALFSAIFSIGRVFAGPLAAKMVLQLGWVNFYWWAFALSFPGLVLLTTLRKKMRVSHAEALG